MQNDIITVKDTHVQAAELVMEDVLKKFKGGKFIITIAGEVSSGKSTLSYLLGRMFKMKGINSKIIDLVDYYIVPPLERRKWRADNGIKSIGFDEYNWPLIEEVMEKFRKDEQATLPLVDLLTDHVDTLITDFKDIQVLIMTGLYASFCKKADYRVFMELTYRETYEAQAYTAREGLDSFRKKILEKEHKVVQEQKNNADIYIDFNTFMNSYHL